MGVAVQSTGNTTSAYVMYRDIRNPSHRSIYLYCTASTKDDVCMYVLYMIHHTLERISLLVDEVLVIHTNVAT